MYDITNQIELQSIHLAFGLPGGWEWIVLLIIGLLVFGRRLPEVGRSVGRSIVEFKKGIKGIEQEINTEIDKPSTPPEQLVENSTKEALNKLEKEGNPYANPESKA